MSDVEPNITSTTETERPVSRFWTWLSRLFRLLLLAVIIIGSTALSYYWLANPPVSQRRPPQPHSILVSVSPAQKADKHIVVKAMGTVVPARTTQIPSRVSGQIEEIAPAFVPGGHFLKGERMLRIDPDTYELTVRELSGNLTRMESEVMLEMGQQAVAEREYALLGDIADEEDEALLLRRPQLAAKQASVEIAKASLEKAKKDLGRTEIFAPFNGLIQTRNVDIGSYVAPGASIANLVGTDAFWVEVSVPADELHWIELPGNSDGKGASARVYHEAFWGPNAYREGTVTQLLVDLEPQGRMARILIEVEDPLDLQKSSDDRRPMLLGAFVRAEIDARDIPGVLIVPRTAVHDGSTIWIMLPDNTLDIREVQTVWGDKEHMFIAEGLQEGELLVISDLPAPIQGMALRTSDSTTNNTPHAPGTPQGNPQ